MTTKQIIQYSVTISMLISYITGGFTAYGYSENEYVNNIHTSYDITCEVSGK